MNLHALQSRHTGTFQRPRIYSPKQASMLMYCYCIATVLLRDVLLLCPPPPRSPRCALSPARRVVAKPRKSRSSSSMPPSTLAGQSAGQLVRSSSPAVYTVLGMSPWTPHRPPASSFFLLPSPPSTGALLPFCEISIVTLPPLPPPNTQGVCHQHCVHTAAPHQCNLSRSGRMCAPHVCGGEGRLVLAGWVAGREASRHQLGVTAEWISPALWLDVLSQSSPTPSTSLVSIHIHTYPPRHHTYSSFPRSPARMTAHCV